VVREVGSANGRPALIEEALDRVDVLRNRIGRLGARLQDRPESASTDR